MYRNWLPVAMFAILLIAHAATAGSADNPELTDPARDSETQIDCVPPSCLDNVYRPNHAAPAMVDILASWVHEGNLTDPTFVIVVRASHVPDDSTSFEVEFTIEQGARSLPGSGANGTMFTARARGDQLQEGPLNTTVTRNGTQTSFHFTKSAVNVTGGDLLTNLRIETSRFECSNEQLGAGCQRDTDEAPHARANASTPYEFLVDLRARAGITVLEATISEAEAPETDGTNATHSTRPFTDGFVASADPGARANVRVLVENTGTHVDTFWFNTSSVRSSSLMIRNGTVDDDVTGPFQGAFDGRWNGSWTGDASGRMDGTFTGHLNGMFDGEHIGTIEAALDVEQDSGWKGHVAGSVAARVNATFNGTFNGTIDGAAFNGTLDRVVDGDINGSFVGSMAGRLTGRVDAAVDIEGVSVLAGKVNGSLLGQLNGTLDAHMNGTVEGTLAGSLDGQFAGRLHGTIAEPSARAPAHTRVARDPANVTLAPGETVVVNLTIQLDEAPLETFATFLHVESRRGVSQSTPFVIQRVAPSPPPEATPDEATPTPDLEESEPDAKAPASREPAGGLTFLTPAAETLAMTGVFGAFAEMILLLGILGVAGGGVALVVVRMRRQGE